MPAPDSTPPWTLDSLRLPKSLDDHPQLPALRTQLRSCSRKLWEGGAAQVPVVRWSEPLASALGNAQREGHLLQGIEQAERTLDREAHGLSIADSRSSTERGSRVSRLLVVSNDGTERFYRQVERLLRTQGPRLLALRLDADSRQLSTVMGDPGGLARALLVEHKTSVARVLLALCESGAPE
jgi:hypothetical protein